MVLSLLICPMQLNHLLDQLFMLKRSIILNHQLHYMVFFGDSYSTHSQPVLGVVSGVIISEDAYIVTNNHAVKNSDRIVVVLHDKRSFEAKLIGQDASIDLALLKAIIFQKWIWGNLII